VLNNYTYYFTLIHNNICKSTSIFINSSFEHVLHSYGLHRFSTYKYEVSNYLFDLHQGIVTNEHEYVTKMAQSATTGGLWGEFRYNVLDNFFLQRPIYVQNKISKCIMS